MESVPPFEDPEIPIDNISFVFGTFFLTLLTIINQY